MNNEKQLIEREQAMSNENEKIIDEHENEWPRKIYYDNINEYAAKLNHQLYYENDIEKCIDVMNGCMWLYFHSFEFFIDDSKNYIEYRLDTLKIVHAILMLADEQYENENYALLLDDFNIHNDDGFDENVSNLLAIVELLILIHK